MLTANKFEESIYIILRTEITEITI
jgi:hypothetical protein